MASKSGDLGQVTAQDFLREIFGDLPSGELCLVAKQKTLEGGFLQMSMGAEAFGVWARRGRRGAWTHLPDTWNRSPAKYRRGRVPERLTVLRAPVP